MSFSSNVKNELFDYFDSNRHCNIAELSAILLECGEFSYDEECDEYYIKVQSENKFAVLKCYKLLRMLFDCECEVFAESTSESQKNILYYVAVFDKNDVFDILNATGIVDGDAILDKINSIIVGSICCKRAFIRGSFIATGSLCNPEKNYHLEFVENSLEFAENLKELINSFSVDSKVVKRKKHFVVYIKEGEQIVEILNIMSAHKALMDLENVRILKDVRNNVNRIVNCETANLNKIVNASVKQREEIEYIQRTVGLSYMPEQLEEVAILRLQYPDLSLKELGEKMVPPVGKSGVNHRLKKIISIAENLREEMCYDRTKS